MTLVELLMNSLLGRLVDANQVVRMLCIRGLGNVASVGAEQVGLLPGMCVFDGSVTAKVVKIIYSHFWLTIYSHFWLTFSGAEVLNDCPISDDGWYGR